MSVVTKPHEAGLYRQIANQSVIWITEKDLRQGANWLAIEARTFSTSNKTKEAEEADLSIVPMLALRYDLDKIPTEVQGPSSAFAAEIPRLHSNFKLNQRGETLYLSHPDGQILDYVELLDSTANQSQGRSLDGDEWRLFSTPSPESRNRKGYSQVLDEPQISNEAGFYADTFSISMQAPKGADIYFTLDGSEPNQSSSLYQQPIILSQTTVLRARAFGENVLPSRVVTQSFFIGEQTTLPVLSLVTDPANLWSPEKGIYVAGAFVEDDRQLANYFQSWTRPASIEYFEPWGELGFQKDVGIELFGASARREARKSIEIKTSGAYSSGSIDYTVFPNYDVQSFEHLILRSSSNDWDKTLIRDMLMQSLLQETGLATQAFRPVLLFINGAYWGIYNLREKMDEGYLKSHYKAKNIDLIEGFIRRDGSLDGRVQQGSVDAYEALIGYVQSHDLSLPEHFSYVAAQMDINNYLSYTAAQIYIANFDWPGHNIRFWRDGTRKWQWLIYDLDYGFGLFQDSRYDAESLSNVLSESPMRFERKLAKRLHFATQITDERFFSTFFL